MNKKHGERKNTAVFALKIIVSIVMVCMVLMVFSNALLRYLFNSGIAEFEELSRYAFIWVATLGAVIAYYQNKHVGVDLVIEKLHGAARLVMLMIGELLVVLALVMLIYGSWGYYISTYTQDSAALPIPLGIITITPLVMGVGMLPKTFLQIKKHFDDYKAEKQHIQTEEEARK